MSTLSGGPNIITDGLVLYLDASNNKSYVSGSTIWNDISRNGNNGTLVNGPTFNPANGGSIVFDGIDDYVSIPYFNLTTDPFSVDIWFNPTQNTSYLRGILSCADVYSGTYTPGWAIAFQQSGMTIEYGVASGSASRTLQVGPTLVAGTTYNLFMHRNTNTQQVLLYVNGILHSNFNYSNSNSLTGNRNTITHKPWAHSAIGPNGNFYSIKVSNNKNFSSQEVLQNYNATKTRFGLT